MNLQAKFGSRINLSIKKANGKIRNHGYFYNHPNSQWIINSSNLLFGSVSNLNIYTLSYNSIRNLGQWQQSGTTISRVSGSESALSTSGSFYKFADGTYAGVKTWTGTTSFTSNISQSVSAQDLYEFSSITSSLSESQSLISNSFTRTYSDGVISLNITSPPLIFNPASSPYTLKCIAIGAFSSPTYRVLLIDIYPEIEIEIGDQIIINSFEYNFDYGDHQPREFAVSPISGISGSGRAQRTRRANERNSSTSPNRIFLISDSNKISIPDMYGPTGGTLVNPSSLTIDQSLTATGSTVNTTELNGYIDSHSCFSNVTSTGTYKQIAWGTTTEIFGIIEYDTPVLIESGKTLTVGMSTQFVPVLTLPS